MKKLKVSFLWCADIRDQVIFKIFEKLSSCQIVITKPSLCDLLFIGSYDHEFYSIKRKILNKFLNKKFFKNLNKSFKNLELYSLRKFKPLRIFITTEPLPFDKNLSFDFSISPFITTNYDNHLRFPLWKETLDWNDYDINHKSNNIKRYGKKIKIENLLRPLEKDFYKKEKDMCFFSSHMQFPRDIIYNNFKKKFNLDGFGKYFNKEIIDHNSSNFFKYDIIKNYKFNLCPANTLMPGYYTQDIVESFNASCLPITWSDQNIVNDFKKGSFINLNDNFQDMTKVIDNLKDHEFLKNFTKEPLLEKKPTLHSEFSFIENILKSF